MPPLHLTMGRLLCWVSGNLLLCLLIESRADFELFFVIKHFAITYSQTFLTSVDFAFYNSIVFLWGEVDISKPYRRVILEHGKYERQKLPKT